MCPWMTAVEVALEGHQANDFEMEARARQMQGQKKKQGRSWDGSREGEESMPETIL